MDIKQEIVELSLTPTCPTPALSVFLDTRWIDEHQRDRARAFVEAELRRAAGADLPPLEDDLRWIGARVQAITAQAELVGAGGVALFACTPVGLRRVLAVRVAFTNAVVLGPRPRLRPLVEALPGAEETLVVWLDRQHARLIPVGPTGMRDELALTGDVPGHHRRGGWAQLAQAHYDRHIQAHRDRHLAAVAAAVRGLVHDLAVSRIVLAGEAEMLGALRAALPAEIRAFVAAEVPGSRYETSAELIARALAAADRAHAATTAVTVGVVLVEAEKSTRATAGLPATLHAVCRGAVHQLYLLRAFRQSGVECERCGPLQVDVVPACPHCGGATTVTELGEAVVRRVLSAKGDVVDVLQHPGLAQHDGLAASLRYRL